VDNNRKNFFWPSYVDLLTALFAIVLVLFVLSFKLFKDKTDELVKEKDKFRVMAQQYERIQKIDTQINTLVNTGLFDYDPEYKRFLVRDFIGKPIFVEQTFSMYEQYKESAKRTGEEIRDLISKFKNDKDISFVVLIESNTALKYDGNPKGTIDGNYELSYKRSLALFKYWEEQGIKFGDRTEVIIAGSGVNGIGRDPIEENNRRFLIQVIPKIKK
jgi:hypothetical protein